jgi:hypothetical protein
LPLRPRREVSSVRAVRGSLFWIGSCAYRVLHGLPPLSLTKTVFDMIDEHVAQVRDLGAPVYKDSDWILLNTAIARDAMNASGLDLVTSFNDPDAGQFHDRPRRLDHAD